MKYGATQHGLHGHEGFHLTYSRFYDFQELLHTPWGMLLVPIIEQRLHEQEQARVLEYVDALEYDLAHARADKQEVARQLAEERRRASRQRERAKWGNTDDKELERRRRDAKEIERLARLIIQKSR